MPNDRFIINEVLAPRWFPGSGIKKPKKIDKETEELYMELYSEMEEAAMRQARRSFQLEEMRVLSRAEPVARLARRGLRERDI